MIGIFDFEEQPTRPGIILRLTWTEERESAALIIVPHDLRRFLEIEETPDIEAIRTLPSALSYAIFLASRFDFDLIVSGDITAWPPKWGALNRASPKPQ